LVDLTFARYEGELVDEAIWEQAVRDDVAGLVRRQVEVGVDLIGDGEASKISYSRYVMDRLSGFEGEPTPPEPDPDVLEFPEFAARAYTGGLEKLLSLRTRPCVGPIRRTDHEAVQRDIANLRSAIGETDPDGVFMTAASPGVIALFFANEFYATREEYLVAIADAMREEYEAIVAAGFTLQLDCPDLAMGRHTQFLDATLEEFRREAMLNVEILNDVTSGIDPRQMRLHLCWGNYNGPHHLDVELADILDIVLTARPHAIALEACNPRHDHEWQLFETVPLPDDKVLIPGVVDSTTNYIEHPQLIAQRLVRYGRIVGMERVIAGSDCGFGTHAGSAMVDPEIAWCKLEAMAEGARRASRELAGSSAAVAAR
jgi:5-methyltetrahydropteroyltriglutamate--homocysteine methyltransferase